MLFQSLWSCALALVVVPFALMLLAARFRAANPQPVAVEIARSPGRGSAADGVGKRHL